MDTVLKIMIQVILCCGRHLYRHSPDELWNGVDDSRRRGSREAMGALRSAFGVPAIPNDIWSRDLAIFPGIQAHSFRRDEASTPPVCYAGDGLGRSPSISRKISWNNSFGTATSAIWKMT